MPPPRRSPGGSGASVSPPRELSSPQLCPLGFWGAAAGRGSPWCCSGDGEEATGSGGSVLLETSNRQHCRVITPFRKLILCAENRKEMEDWISALKSVQKWEIHEATQFNMEHFSGMHNWYACSHARPTFCNVCREALPGVTSHGLSCEGHCASPTNNCKWTTLASIGTEIIEDEDGVAMPHQWLEGNLPVSARCAVCDRTCGSVRRLQDWRCLWCKAIVHSACKELFGKRCPLGQYKVSIIPPTALNSIDSDGFWKATCPSTCSSPLLAFVNSKSGDNQGVKFLRKFKQFLNPAQVFDLMNGGLGMSQVPLGTALSPPCPFPLPQCQLGVLPLGTGNDLARVLGWGSLCDDDTQLLQILEKLERATTKMLDRWSVLTYEAPKQSPPAQISHYADSVAFHLAKILESDKHSVVISSAKFLCGTVNDFVAEVGRAYKRATENKQEAELMARKVGCRGAGGLGRAGWHSPRAVEGLAASAPAAHARAVPEVPRHLGCPGQLGVSRHTGFPNT
uniref:diacylglycerol kinase (ATP) n=1 Tax=Buteo japonicus TaxID=224669 RepID=A0A8C0HF59_9AVES